MPGLKKISRFLEGVILLSLIFLLAESIFLRPGRGILSPAPVYKMGSNYLEFPMKISHLPARGVLSLVSFDVYNWAERAGYNPGKFQKCLDKISIFKSALPLETINQFILSRNINWWSGSSRSRVFIRYKSPQGKSIVAAADKLLKIPQKLSLEKLMFLGLGMFEFSIENSVSSSNLKLVNPCVFLRSYFSCAGQRKFSSEAVKNIVRGRNVELILKSDE